MMPPSRIVELLAFGQGPEGCWLELGLLDTAGGGGLTRCVTDIEESLFRELSALQPLNGNPVRLSFYTHWDPFRKVHYGTMTRMNRGLPETLYYACPENFGERLLELAERPVEQAAEPADKRAGAEAAAAEPEITATRIVKSKTAETEPAKAASKVPGAVPELPRSRRYRRAGLKRSMLRTLRTAVILLLAFYFSFRPEGRLLHERVEALSPYANAAGTGVSEKREQEAAEGEKPALEQEQQASQPVAEGNAARAVAALSPPAADALKTAGAEAAAVTAVTAGLASSEAAARQAEQLDIGSDKSFFGLKKGYVALSFDDGPSKYTKKIVDMLTEEGVAATFLFVGKNAVQFPDEVTYASSHGMAVGNHSWDHSMMTKLNRTAQKDNIDKTNAVLEPLVGAPITIFRPPYGAINETLAGSVKELRMKVLLWNRDAEDWNAKSPEDILRYIRSVDPSGGVYVLHEDKYTVEALPELIRMLKEKQLTFTVFK